MTLETSTGERPIVRANKMDLLERIADDLAHEIKNPLHSMVINLEVLRRRVVRPEGSEPEELLRYVGVLDGELERVHRRVELLLRMMRPSGGQDPVPLEDVLAEMVELLEVDCSRRRIALRYTPHAVGMRARVPRAIAYQALLNLMLATLDSLAEGGTLVVELQGDEASATLRVRGEGDLAEHERDAVAAPEELVRELVAALGGRVDGGPVATAADRPLEYALTLPL